MADSQELREIKRLEDKFDEHIKEDREYMNEVRSELKVMWKSIGERVTWAWLWTILVFLVGVVGAMFGILYSNQKEMSDDFKSYFEKNSEQTAVIREDLSSVNTIIKNLNFKVIK